MGTYSTDSFPHYFLTAISLANNDQYAMKFFCCCAYKIVDCVTLGSSKLDLPLASACVYIFGFTPSTEIPSTFFWDVIWGFQPQSTNIYILTVSYLL